MSKAIEKWETLHGIDFLKINILPDVIIEKRYLDSDPSQGLDFAYEYNEYLEGYIDDRRVHYLDKYNFRKSTLYQVIISVNLFNKEGQPLVPINRFW